MSDHLDEALQHRFVYLPRGTEKDTLGSGKQLGLAQRAEAVEHAGQSGGEVR